MKNMNQAQDKDTNHVKAQRYQKHEEVSVISPACKTKEDDSENETVYELTNAVVDPWAVVIKDLNTVITNTAVTAPRWSVELAGDTPLHTNLGIPSSITRVTLPTPTTVIPLISTFL